MGSNASLRPSPNRLKLRIIRLISKPGDSSRYGKVFNPLRASLASEPRDGKGMATPRPRKLKKLSVKMEAGICKVVVTIKVPMQFVSRCLRMTRPWWAD